MTPLALLDDDLDYAIDYREQDLPTSNRVFLTKAVPRSGQEKLARQSRFSRRGGSARSLNGIHRRGNK